MRFVRLLAVDAPAHQLRARPDRERLVDGDLLTSPALLSQPIAFHRTGRDGFISPPLKHTEPQLPRCLPSPNSFFLPRTFSSFFPHSILKDDGFRVIRMIG